MSNKFYYKILACAFLSDLLTYYDTQIYAIGSYCIVDLKGKKVLGIIWQNISYCLDNNSIKYEIKKIEYILPLPIISLQYLTWIEKIAYFNIESPGFILKHGLSVVNSSLKSFIEKKSLSKILLKNNNVNLFYNEEQVNEIINYTKDYLNLNAQFKTDDNFLLNEFQQIAYQKFKQSMLSQMSSVFLLEGETGSGKTEVYLEIIKDLIANDFSSQILILVPEIALTNALLYRIEKRLGLKTFYWNSSLSLKEKKECFLAVSFGIAKIIVGARSAIFLPFSNLKLIVIDEEHDASFKQDQGFIYHCNDLAMLRSKYQKIPLILSSATPSLETIYAVKQKQIIRIALESPKSLQQRMNIILHDMAKEEDSIFSKALLNRISFYIERKLQVMVFLNRRGYHSLIICKNCNNKLCCKNCTVNLTYHKELNRFYCHYCGFNIDTNQITCLICKQNNGFRFKGFGIEKIYEILQENFPQAVIVMLSSDNNNSENMFKIISEIESGKIDIIVGTQILAKGHNFPHLGFLAILDGGLNFSGIDLRAAEKTFQILHQISGRVGRFDIKGEVFIQTYEPKNLILNALQSYNKTQFYARELSERQKFFMPPFYLMIKISFSAFFKETCLIEANKFVGSLPIESNIRILGPSPSAIFKLSKKYRYNVFLQSAKEFDLHGFLCAFLSKIKFNNKVVVRIDVNPLNFI